MTLRLGERESPREYKEESGKVLARMKDEEEGKRERTAAPWTVALQAPLSMEYWNRLPLPTPGVLVFSTDHTWWTRVEEKKERKREKEASLLWVAQRTNKALGQGLYHSRRHRASS